MAADVLGQISAAPRTHDRAAVERIGGELGEPKATVAGQALSDEVLPAVDGEQIALVRGQASGASTVGPCSTTLTCTNSFESLPAAAPNSSDRLRSFWLRAS